MLWLWLTTSPCSHSSARFDSLEFEFWRAAHRIYPIKTKLVTYSRKLSLLLLKWNLSGTIQHNKKPRGHDWLVFLVDQHINYISSRVSRSLGLVVCNLKHGWELTKTSHKSQVHRRLEYASIVSSPNQIVQGHQFQPLQMRFLRYVQSVHLRPSRWTNGSVWSPESLIQTKSGWPVFSLNTKWTVRDFFRGSIIASP